MPNAQILWVRIDLTSGERKFVTLPLRDFYQYIDLPESSIGGWTEGELGTDEAGMRSHLEKYKHGGDGETRTRSEGPEEESDLRDVASDAAEMPQPTEHELSQVRGSGHKNLR